MFVTKVILVVSYSLFLYNFWRAVYSQRVYRFDIFRAQEEACHCLKWTVGYGLIAMAMIVLLANK